MGDKEVVSNQLFIDRWFFPEPKLIPDSDGNIVIVSKVSVGPCEYFEWGITANMTCFEKYEWCENDWFKDSSYIKGIEKNKLIDVIQTMKNQVEGTSLEYWNKIYDDFLDKLSGE